MTRYATALAGNPEATYRQIDIAGRTGEADPHALVGLLYEELIRALRASAWAVEKQQHNVRSEKVTRAIAILFALEAGLDFDGGGDVSRTLARLYHGARQRLVDASLGSDPAPFLEIATTMEDIAGAWQAVRR